MIILEHGGRRRPGLYADIPVPVLQLPAGEEGGPGGLPNTLKEGEKDENWEEKKEDDDDEEEMEGKRKDGEDMQDSLVVEEGQIVKFPMVPFATCLLPLQLLLQDYFQQEEVEQPHWRYTHIPNIMKYVVPPARTGLPEQCSTCGKNFSRKSSLSKHMLVVHGAGRFKKILKDRYLVKF